jgi:peptidoglycan/LPS O-acetylase OafA/YrhL
MSKQLKSLQILRALAASFVVYFHIAGFEGYTKWVVFGSFGVDIFFVLSGYVIALTVTANPSAINFIINRTSRIIPSYWLLTLAVFALALVKPELLSSTKADFGNLFLSLFFIPYFKENGFLEPVLAVGWTLNYEMYFYLCTFLCILFFRKNGIIAVIFPVSIAFVIANLANLPTSPYIKFISSWRVLEFMCGILIYKFIRYEFVFNLSKSLIMSFLAILCICLLAIQEIAANPLISAISSIFLSSAIVILFIKLEPAFEKLPKRFDDFLIAIGDASYATYLTHFFTMNLFIKILCEKMLNVSGESVLLASLNFIICLIGGQIFYIIIDNPLHRKVRYTLRKVFRLG